jgi:hypothetical protein
MATCSSCRAPIFWAKSASTGKPMPIDAEPVDNGNLAIDAGKAFLLNAEQRAAYRGPRYRSHHASCPDAAKWRRPREAARG